jgi:serine/threonine protein kinase
MPSAPSIPPPPVGSVIADGSLELVDILGYGGYGVVYRAVDTATRRQQYAVKCLTHAQASRQRNLHLREIQLHRIASAHPAVVSLSHVIDDARFTYIVLDYYADGDLFTQILHKKRYLGNEALIRDVYLQLLDAVQHCHDLGVCAYTVSGLVRARAEHA